MTDVVEMPRPTDSSSRRSMLRCFWPPRPTIWHRVRDHRRLTASQYAWVTTAYLLTSPSRPMRRFTCSPQAILSPHGGSWHELLADSART